MTTNPPINQPPRVSCLLTTRDYYYGDSPPPYEAGYGEFVAWQEAQFKRRQRPKGVRAREEHGSHLIST